MNENLKKLLIAIGCVVVCMGGTKLVGIILGPFSANGYVNACIGELILAVLAITALVLIKKASVLRFKTEGFMEGIWTGTTFLVLGAMSFITFFVKGMSVTASNSDILVFVIYMILVGIAEEVLFRGILQNCVMEYIGTDSVAKVRIGIVIASVLFGSVHLGNAFFPGVSFTDALQQAISVIPMGALFGTIYFRSKNNIWPGILLHAFNDFYTLLIGGYISNSSLGEAISGTSGGVLGTLALYTIIDLWIMRKKKLEKCIIAKD